MAKTPTEMAKGNVLDVEMRAWIVEPARTQRDLEEFIRERQLHIGGPGDLYTELAQNQRRLKIAEEALMPHWSTWVALALSAAALFVSYLAWKRPVQVLSPALPTTALTSNSVPALQLAAPPPLLSSNTPPPTSQPP